MSVTACHLHHERVSLEENLELGTNQEKKGKKKTKTEKNFHKLRPLPSELFCSKLRSEKGLCAIPASNAKGEQERFV